MDRFPGLFLQRRFQSRDDQRAENVIAGGVGVQPVAVMIGAGQLALGVGDALAVIQEHDALARSNSSAASR